LDRRGGRTTDIDRLRRWCAQRESDAEHTGSDSAQCRPHCRSDSIRSGPRGAGSSDHYPAGRQKQTGVEAWLTISGFSGPPGSKVTYDASESAGVVVKYEWDLDGDGSYDRTTTDPVLKHTYEAEFEGVMILRVTGIAGGTDVLETPVRIRTTPLYLAAASNVRIEVLSTVGTISEVRVSWESNDPAVYRWGVAVDGIPAGMREGSARSVNVTDVHHEEEVLIEVIGFTAGGAMGERAGAVLAAAEW
jgi:hypothetical protein